MQDKQVKPMVRPLVWALDPQPLRLLQEIVMHFPERDETEPTDGPLSVGVDVGNSTTVLVGGGKELVIPSVIALNGPGEHRFFAGRQLAPGSYGQLAPDEHLVSFDGMTTQYVGRVAVELADGPSYGVSTTRGDESRYATFGRDLFLTALAAAFPRTNQLTVQVATGVPTALWTHALRDEIVAAWAQTHRYRYNGRAMVVAVKGVKVLAEGHAASTMLPQRQQQGTVLVLDIGGRTMNGVWITDSVVDMNRLWTEPLGVEGVLDQISDALLAQGHRTLTMRERRGLLDAVKAGDTTRYDIIIGGKRVRTDQVARQVFTSAAKRGLQQLRLKMDYTRADQRVVVGGGVYFHGPAIVAADPSWTLAVQPELLNARGYYEQLAGQAAKAKRGAR